MANMGNRPSNKSNANAAKGTRPPVRQARAAQQKPDEREKKPKKKAGNTYRWFMAVIMVIATVAGCIFLSVFILDSAQDLFGLNQPDQFIEITIPENASNSDVAQILRENEIITKTLTFMLYSSIKVDEGDFLGGDYRFNSNMGYDQIISRLKYKAVQEQVATVRLIEGWTLREIANELEKNKICNAEEFIKYLNTGEFNYEFIDQLPDSELKFYNLEGYIFPDTYEFYIGESVENVAAKFLNNFNRKLTEEMEAKRMKFNLTLDELITLASIIQKEAGEPDEMAIVSSVFHNRLNRSDIYPMLQSDVTIFYANSLKRYSETVNQPMYDAYNTYVSNGLPIGPICNPGLDAIEAALNPAESNYYFFVTDVNGKYYYSETTDEHNANVTLARSQTSEDDNGSGEVHGTGVQGN